MSPSFLFGFRLLFYAVWPSEVAFERLSDVPPLTSRVLPFATGLMAMEVVSARLFFRRTDVHNSLDCLTGLSLFFVVSILRGLVGWNEFLWYDHIHRRFSLFSLPWNSPLHFLLGLFLVDFLRYWIHRLEHEVLLLWAIHKSHHSSEYLNMFGTMRNSVFDPLLSALWFSPLAVILPPQHIAVHLALNDIYPFWTHTCLIPKLDILEWLLITPSLHRVHHGRNAYCLDKNYAHILSIFDRMFGTFQCEKDASEERLVFGTVSPTQTLNPIKLQLDVGLLLRKWRSVEKPADKLKILLKGPGWTPPEAINANDDVIIAPTLDEPPIRFRRSLPWYSVAYLALQFLVCLGALMYARKPTGVWSGIPLVVDISILIGFYSIGDLSDSLTQLNLSLELPRLAWMAILMGPQCYYFFYITAAISAVWAVALLWCQRKHIAGAETVSPEV